MPELTDKERAFVEHYLACWNATEAARRVSPDAKRPDQLGYEYLRKPEIRATIAARLDELKLGADEVLARLSDLARADIRALLAFDETGNFAGLRLHQDAPLHLIKKLTPTRYGTAIELHDAAAMLIKLGEHHGLFGKGDGVLKYIDLAKLTDDQLARLANGDDPLRVILQS